MAFQFDLTSEKIEKVTKTFPVLFLMFILIGFLKELFYYTLYGVNITNYISWDEVIFIALDSILKFILLTLIFLIIKFIQNKIKDVETAWKIPSVVMAVFFVIVIGVPSYIISQQLKVTQGIMYFNIILTVASIFFTVTKQKDILYEPFQYFKKEIKKDDDLFGILRSYVIIAFVIVLVSNTIDGFLRYKDLFFKNAVVKVKLIESYNTDIVGYDFIGQTSNFVFLSDGDSVKIIPVDKVLSVTKEK